jgi:hypothetical protein
LNYQDFSFPRQFFREFTRKLGLLCPGLLSVIAFVQTLTVPAFINQSFSVMVRISHIQSASVSSGESLQVFHKTERL